MERYVSEETEESGLDRQALGCEWFAAAKVGEAVNEWALVEQLLPAGWQEQAKPTCALQRRRGFDGPRSLLRVMLLHLAEGISLRQTARQAAEGGLVDVSDVALLKRLRHCGDWFGWMTQQLAGTLMPPLTQAAAQALPGRQPCAVDGSTVCGPGAKGARWRLHYLLDLPHLRCRQVQVTPEAQAESLTRFALAKGDVVLADRGFVKQYGIAHAVRRQADVIVRAMLHEPLLHDAAGERVDILALLRTLPEECMGDWPVWLPGQDGAIAMRLVAWKKPAAETRKAQDKLRRSASKRQKKLRPDTLEAAGYVFLLTTLMEVEATTILGLYRVRWQIELAFKRLKSLLQLGELKKTDTDSARAWLQGKLLLACLIEKMIATGALFSPRAHRATGKDACAPLPVARNPVDARLAGSGNPAGAATAADAPTLGRYPSIPARAAATKTIPV